MMITLLTISMTSTIMLMMMSHPISMGMTLLMQTLSIALMTGMMNYNFWYSYLLFMIMIGGMLVLFIYMTSVASNEKFNFSFNALAIITIIFTSLLTIMYMVEPLILKMDNLSSDNSSVNLMFKTTLSKFINYPTSMIMYLMIIYLLITLIAVVKTTSMNNGPLRQMN